MPAQIKIDGNPINVPTENVEQWFKEVVQVRLGPNLEPIGYVTRIEKATHIRKSPRHKWVSIR